MATPFADSFRSNLDDIEHRLHKAGSNLTQLCKRSGVARATVDRWRGRPPQTISKMDELVDELEKIEKEALLRQTASSDRVAEAG